MRRNARPGFATPSKPRAAPPLRLALAAALWATGGALLAFAYNAEQDDVNGPVPARWVNATVSWSLNPTVGSNVHTDSSHTVQSAISNAFSTWRSTPLTSQIGVVNNLTISQGPNTVKTDPDISDCVNVVSFSSTSAVKFPTGAIAFTQVVTAFGPVGNNPYTCGSGAPQQCPLKSCLIDADIVFNPGQQFSTVQPTPANDFDVRTIATHEIGHLLGLDHSGVAAAVMYPFGDTGQSGSTKLAVDDAAGIAFVYPASNFNTVTGTLSGSVTLNSQGIFGAHVVAIDSSTGDAVIDGLTDTNGKYSLAGLPPGSYQILVLPLGPDANSGLYTLDNFGGWACGFAGPKENSPPCCDPRMSGCTGAALSNPTNYTGTFH
jgi:hypothetical protein